MSDVSINTHQLIYPATWRPGDTDQRKIDYEVQVVICVAGDY